VSSLRAKPAFPEAVTSLLVSDIWQRYSLARSHRKHDADWFCRKFEIAI
jgi:hypothetical protein